MPWVYMLRCRDGTLYTGAALDVGRRLAQHGAGRASRYTRARLPVELVWSRRTRDWSGALREERRIKALPRVAKEELVRLAERSRSRAAAGARPGRRAARLTAGPSSLTPAPAPREARTRTRATLEGNRRRRTVDVAGTLGRVAGFLDERGHPHVVIGALALHAYGLERGTHDVDLAVPAAAQPALVAFLESLGYETLHRSPGYSNHLHPDPERGRVDFVYLDEETGRRLFGAAREAGTVGGRRYRVPSPEHLIALKVHAIRNDPRRLHGDLADIQFLLNLAGVDAAEVRGYFARAGLEERYDELRRLG